MTSPRLTFLAAAIIVATAACSDDSSTTSTTSAPVTTAAATTVAPTVAPTVGSTAAAPTTTAAPAGVDSAGRVEYRQTVLGFVQNTVIAFGEQGLDPEIIAKAVITTYPTLEVRGSAVEADETGISVWSNTAVEKQDASATNPYVFAVAVMDTTGKCVGGAAYGFPVATMTVTIEDPSECTGGAVAEAVIAGL